jgi:hypothetical protein
MDFQFVADVLDFALGLHAYLDQAGEREVAALLSDCPGEDG